MKHIHRIFLSIFLFFVLYMILRYINSISIKNNLKNTSNKEVDFIYDEPNLDNNNSEINIQNEIHNDTYNDNIQNDIHNEI